MATQDNDNVIIGDFSSVTEHEIPVDRVLDGAKAAELTDVLVLGWTEDGKFYAAANHGEVARNLLLLEKCRFMMLV